MVAPAVLQCRANSKPGEAVLLCSEMGSEEIAGIVCTRFGSQGELLMAIKITRSKDLAA